MTALLNRFAGFLGSPAGFWATMAATGLSIAFAWLINLEVATFSLAWLAIVLPALILVQQSAHNRALHMKLDDLIRAGPADNALRGIERLPREKIEEIDQRENGAQKGAT